MSKVIFGIIKEPRRDASGTTRWIGFEDKSINGSKKKFIWWKNFTTEDTPLEEFKLFCERILAQYRIEAKIGPAIDLHKSKESKRPRFLHGAKGIYIEAGRRKGFNFF